MAQEADAEAVASLINRAFRVERFFMEGDRTGLAKVLALMRAGGFLLLTEGSNEAAGCVYVEVRGQRAYLGLLAVEPAHQRRGLGRRLVSAAEDHARAKGCLFMDMRIVNLREELPPFYRALGYAETGTEAFAADEKAKVSCHFIVMSKKLSRQRYAKGYCQRLLSNSKSTRPSR